MVFSNRSVQSCSRQGTGAGDTAISSPIRANDAMHAPPEQNLSAAYPAAALCLSTLTALFRWTSRNNFPRRRPPSYTSTSKLSPPYHLWSTVKMPQTKLPVIRAQPRQEPPTPFVPGRVEVPATSLLPAATPRASRAVTSPAISSRQALRHLPLRALPAAP